MDSFFWTKPGYRVPKGEANVLDRSREKNISTCQPNHRCHLHPALPLNITLTWQRLALRESEDLLFTARGPEPYTTAYPLDLAACRKK